MNYRISQEYYISYLLILLHSGRSFYAANSFSVFFGASKTIKVIVLSFLLMPLLNYDVFDTSVRNTVDALRSYCYSCTSYLFIYFVFFFYHFVMFLFFQFFVFFFFSIFFLFFILFYSSIVKTKVCRLIFL